MATIDSVKLDRPVEFMPYCHGEPLDNTQHFFMDAECVQPFIDELTEMGKIDLIEESLQSLWMRKDGTLLKTAFPDLDDFKSTAEKMKSIPRELAESLCKWKSLGANEIDISFEQKFAHR
ncbi:hypothetical protein [Aeromonas caviae]|uniref:hypothetical protein n=1 Tax=Aeromonas caviae TaxID=648 RepID=UPI00244C5BD3|nr:hypothetical protein [Aeromonas caviae]MDH1848004.1 hypothetical protein [Aeromonas caviae]